MNASSFEWHDWLVGGLVAIALVGVIVLTVLKDTIPVQLTDFLAIGGGYLFRAVVAKAS